MNVVDLNGGGLMVVDAVYGQPATRLAHYACAESRGFLGWPCMAYNDDGVHNLGDWTHGPCAICGREMRSVEVIPVTEAIHF